jgi:CheY-like chemotaxis protein
MLTKPAVLVVEDEPLIRFMAVDAVEDLGVPALEAQDADEALELLDAHPQVKVLFTDVDMPGTMDGVQLAACVHEKRPEIGIVVTSGKRVIRHEALPDQGCFLPKPYRPEQLMRAVASKLQK